ncbi:F-box protein At5g07610-like isoform X2 [Salvia miltiorrhiza]|nr:F-box protein At5g07610-like isoform X2 [Salvia miltiorrhiza]XP_057800668.1 F-box protein At5g07610-like isoform X2 [Salvia miltiorrhiza]XP_057800669.1 F-box protein At5g07610-like isoform X2 [Salvia miltiorrhiza]
MITENNDLLTEILLWLPAKSLIRFKLVSKKWLDLISSHHFSEQHTLQQRHQRCHSKLKPSLLLHLAEASTYLYLHSSPNGEKLVPYAFSSTLVEPTLRSFSNGLFLLQCRNVEKPFEVYCVYNPTTKQSKEILLNVDDMYRCVLGLNLVFDPLKSPHYKIFCIKATPRRSFSFWRSWWRRCQIEVYESDTSTWKLCGEPFLAPREVVFDHGIEWKGCIHWCGVFFDLQECVLGKHPEIVIAGDAGTEGFHQKYVESNGFLHNVAHFPEKKSVMVFELQRDYSKWSLKYHINLDGASGSLSVLSYIRGESEDEEDSKLVLHEPGKIKFYALRENCVKGLVDFGGTGFYQEGRSQSASNHTFQLIETLACV